MNAALASAGIEPIVSRNDLDLKIARTLALYVGRRGRRYTYKELTNGTGVPERAVEAAMHMPGNPEFRPLRADYLLSLSKFLGPEFTACWLCLADQGSFYLPEVNTEKLSDLGELAADLADDSAALTRRAHDKANDADLREIGNRLIVTGAQLMERERKGEPQLFEQEMPA